MIFGYFLFYAKGMNMNDIARLKWKDIDEINGKKFLHFIEELKDRKST